MSSTAVRLPPTLREGDRLDSPEFLRRWEAIPALKQAELIDGTVFMPSPVSNSHGTAHVAACLWAGLYADATPGCQAGSECSWVMGRDSVPQPDVSLRILPEFGGQSSQTGDYVSGAPELIVEITGSSASRDLGVKLDLYRRAGVREYLTILLKPRTVIWRHLTRGRFPPLEADAGGWLRSRVFPGLWLNPEALWSPKQSIRTALEAGLSSPAHAAFVRRSQSRHARRS